MIKDDIHECAGLPPLRTNKNNDRKEIENEPKVKNLINTHLLLSKNMKILLDDLITLSDKIEEIVFSDDPTAKFLVDSVMLKYPTSGENVKHLRNYLFHMPLVHPDIRRKTQKFAAEELKIRTEVNDVLLNELATTTNQTVDTINKFEKNHGIDLDITRNVTIFICAKCKSINSIDRFKRGKCRCGKLINSSSSAQQKSFTILNSAVRKFIAQDMWLEEGFAYLLRKKGYQVKTGISILGRSGVFHEIDNLAEKDHKMRLFCECKSSVLKLKDIFNFIGKMNEIGCHCGIMVTVADEVELDILKVARGNNITIVSSIYKKSPEQIVSEIPNCPI